jgi:hypothetical protein
MYCGQWGDILEIFPGSKFIYDDLRSKWVHEDNLINQRVTWLLTMQAFLLTSYGVLAKLRMDASWKSESSWVERVFSPFSLSELAVPIIALFILYFLRKAIRAAINAMSLLKSTLEIHQKAGRVWEGVSIDVLHQTTQDGAKAPIRMITAFQVVWIALLIFELISFGYR